MPDHAQQAETSIHQNLDYDSELQKQSAGLGYAEPRCGHRGDFHEKVTRSVVTHELPPRLHRLPHGPVSIVADRALLFLPRL